MAVIDWPVAFGYAEFSEMPYRVRGPFVHRSVFTGRTHVSYGGGRRRRGYIITPVSRTGTVQIEITALVQQLFDPGNQIRLTLPRITGAGTLLIGNVIRISPPERDDRGTWRGWRLDFVEQGIAAVLPIPIAIRTVDFGVAALGLIEGAAGVLPVRLNQDAPPGGLIVRYTIGGTATSGTDYTALPGTVVIPAGMRSVNIPISILDDAVHEPAETIVLTLTDTADYDLGTTVVATVTIAESDIPVVDFGVAALGLIEGASGVLPVRLNQDAPPGGLIVRYTIGGTATSGTDYTALPGTVVIPAGMRSVNIPISILDDAVHEPAETIVLTLTDTADYDLGTTVVATVTIAESDIPVVDFGVAALGLIEGASGVLPVRLNQDAPPGGLIVRYTIGGTATSGTDYTALPGTVVIPAGMRLVNIPISILDDAMHEPAETIVLTLTDTADYDLGTTVVATVTIAESDIPVVDFGVAALGLIEGASGVLPVRLNQDAPPGGLIVRYTIGGTATSGTDYTALPGTVVIPAGMRSVNIPISILDDAVHEPAETIVLTLTDTADYDLGTTVVATVIIAESDIPVLPVGEVQVQVRGDQIQFTTIPPVPDGYRLDTKDGPSGSLPSSPYTPTATSASTRPVFAGGKAQSTDSSLIDPGYGFATIARSSSIALDTTFTDADDYVQLYATLIPDTEVAVAPAGSIGVPGSSLTFNLGAPPVGVNTVLVGADYKHGAVPAMLSGSGWRDIEYLAGFAPTANGRYEWRHSDLAANNFGYRYYVQYLDIHGRGSAVVSLGTKDP